MPLLNILISPTGNLVTGSVHDCNKAALERSLQFYDPLLYIQWNPKKRRGWGMWEVRRKPESLTRNYQGQLNGCSLSVLERKENSLINHVLDVPMLRYDVLGKIKSMDAWNYKNFTAEADYNAEKHQQREKDKARAEMRYNLKQHMREWREFASLVSQGMNPAKVLKGRW